MQLILFEWPPARCDDARLDPYGLFLLRSVQKNNRNSTAVWWRGALDQNFSLSHGDERAIESFIPLICCLPPEKSFHD